jgi:hypothetical protein
MKTAEMNIQDSQFYMKLIQALNFVTSIKMQNKLFSLYQDINEQHLQSQKQETGRRVNNTWQEIGQHSMVWYVEMTQMSFLYGEELHITTS